VEERYTWERAVAMLEGVYRRVREQRNRGVGKQGEIIE